MRGRSVRSDPLDVEGNPSEKGERPPRMGRPLVPCLCVKWVPLDLNRAGCEVDADLALHPVECVVDRLRIALEPLADHLV